MNVCARSWSVPGSNYWWFCLKERGHQGECESIKGPRLPQEIPYESQPAAQAMIADQIAKERKAIAKKESKE